MSILFKTLALVLCFTFLFAVMIPQVQANWNWWQCAAGVVACGAAWAAAAKACVVAGPACVAATSLAMSICATVAANC